MYRRMCIGMQIWKYCAILYKTKDLCIHGVAIRGGESQNQCPVDTKDDCIYYGSGAMLNTGDAEGRRKLPSR